jgi:isocitrate/isopropylmalate dehydrogenase
MTRTNRVYRIAVIPGDGIGKEVMPEGLRVLEAAAKQYGFELRLDTFDFSSCDYYAKHGRMLPEDWKEQISGHDATSTSSSCARTPRASIHQSAGACTPAPSARSSSRRR